MKRIREYTCSGRVSWWVLFLSIMLILVLLQGLALGQVIKPGKTPIINGPMETDEDHATIPDTGPQHRISILIHLAGGADRAPLRGFIQNQGAFVKYTYNVVLPNVINVRDFPTSALNGLLSIPGVESWEEDRPVHIHMNDSTPLIRALQSQISNAGFSADGSGVRVCVLDTGIDSDSAMYSSRIDTAAARDFVNNDNDPEDDNGHGSHVAGTAVGGTNLIVDFGCVGSEPFHGVAPGATLVGIKVLDAAGNGIASDVIAGIDYGAEKTISGGSCDVINLSIGGGLYSGQCDSDSIAVAANNAVDQGVVVIASSGNDDQSNMMRSPACGSKVISVGATYDDDYPNCEFPNQTQFEFCTSGFSIFCLTYCTDNAPSVDQIGCYSNESDELDVTAPGCITFSADHEGSPYGIVGRCGTSMAAPHVAGLAALLLSRDPSLTPAEVRQIIREGAIDLGAPGFDPTFGFGRIDVINSLSLVGPQCGVDSDCNDGNECTTDTCFEGNCVNEPNCGSDGQCCAECENDPDCSQAYCGDGSCDAGEDCHNCPDDCIGKQTGKPSTRYCCGNGICEGGETETNCDLDCGDGGGSSGGGCSSNAECDDGNSCTTDTCESGDCYNTWPDCGVDDGCCGPDCSNDNDLDCAAASCEPKGTECTSGEQCCSGQCHPTKGVCK